MSGATAVTVSGGIQLSLGVVLLAAAVTKARRPARFVATVRGYRVLPQAFAVPVATAVLAAELVVAAAFLSGWGMTLALPLAAVLFAGFGAAVGIVLRSGRSVSCGCFGSAGERVSRRTLARVGLLLAATAAVAVLGTEPLHVADLVRDGMAGIERFAASLGLAAFLAILAAWLLRLPELWPLLSGLRVDRERK